MDIGHNGVHGKVVVLHVEEEINLEIEHVQSQHHSMVETIATAIQLVWNHAAKCLVLVRSLIF